MTLFLCDGHVCVSHNRAIRGGVYIAGMGPASPCSVQSGCLGVWLSGSVSTMCLRPKLVCACVCISGQFAFTAGLACRGHTWNNMKVKTPGV